MTARELKLQTRKDLAGMAKSHGVVGWHAMRKDELIQALSRLARNKRRKAASGKGRNSQSARNGSTNHKNGKPAAKTNGVRRSSSSDNSPTLKNLAIDSTEKVDRLFVVAHDSYWLHALWELSHATIKRAEAGLGIEWHTAHPVIRVMDVSSDESRQGIEQFVRDVEIHGGVNHWYIEVTNPPGVYRLQIGYLTTSGRFFSLARSGIVKTPAANARGVLDESWGNIAGQSDNKSNGATVSQSSNGNGNGHARQLTDFFPRGLREGEEELRLEMDAELIVHGSARPNSHVTILGDAVELREDGSFSVQLSLPDGRQVIPAAVTSADGSKQQTVVIALERNTKRLEMQHLDDSEL